MAFDEETTLRVWWSKRERNWMISYPSKTDGWLAYDFLRGGDNFPAFIEELQRRGYGKESFRLSAKKAAPDKGALRVWWSKAERDWMIDSPTSATGSMASGFLLGRSAFRAFENELKERGYDLHTLKFHIRKPKKIETEGE